jgi:uncharacterized membrane protein (UPF0127 family)
LIRLAFGLACVVLLTVAAAAVAKPAVPAWRDSHSWSTHVATVIVGDITLEAEIADTAGLRSRGLSYRDQLDPGTAMLFVFDGFSSQSFWMRGMRFCLDIVWIADDTIVGAAEKVCPMPDTPEADLPRYTSDVPVNYVLEVPAGWLEMNDFGAGTKVEFRLPQDPDS